MRRAAVVSAVAVAASLAAAAPALGEARTALFVEHLDVYGRPISGPWVSLHAFAEATGASFGYVGHPGTADFDYELARPTPVGSVVLEFHQDGVPSGASLRR